MYPFSIDIPNAPDLATDILRCVKYILRVYKGSFAASGWRPPAATRMRAMFKLGS